MDNTDQTLTTTIEIFGRQIGDLTGSMRVMQENYNREFKEVHNNITEILRYLKDQEQKFQATIDKLTDIQQNQGYTLQNQQRDINDIQLTLKKFTEIQKKVDSNAEKIAELENRQKSELELNKEKIKGRWVAIAAFITSGLALLATIITKLI